MNINNDDALKIYGGGITASLVNAATNLIKTIYSLGQNLGSTIRRLVSKTSC